MQLWARVVDVFLSDSNLRPVYTRTVLFIKKSLPSLLRRNALMSLTLRLRNPLGHRKITAAFNSAPHPVMLEFDVVFNFAGTCEFTWFWMIFQLRGNISCFTLADFLTPYQLRWAVYFRFIRSWSIKGFVGPVRHRSRRILNFLLFMFCCACD